MVLSLRRRRTADSSSAGWSTVRRAPRSNSGQCVALEWSGAGRKVEGSMLARARPRGGWRAPAGPLCVYAPTAAGHGCQWALGGARHAPPPRRAPALSVSRRRRSARRRRAPPLAGDHGAHRVGRETSSSPRCSHATRPTHPCVPRMSRCHGVPRDTEYMIKYGIHDVQHVPSCQL